MLGLNCVDELINKSFTSEEFGIDPTYAQQLHGKLIKGEVELEELKLKRANGKDIYVTVFFNYKREPHNFIESIRAIVYDITAKKELVAQKEMEFALRKSEQELTQFRFNADKANAELAEVKKQLEKIADSGNNTTNETALSYLAKGKFLVNMSHEIRTPLNAIIGLSEVLTEDGLTEEQVNHLDIIRDSAQKILLLINGILDFSTIEDGRLGVEVTESSLEHLLATVESTARPKAAQKNIAFGIFQKTDLPVCIETDPLRFCQCLINLTNNAIDCTEHGHVRINISMVDQADQPFIKFEVEDTGVGIAEEDREKVFHEFAQLANIPNRQNNGTGLGLTLTKKLIEVLGGKVELTSAIGKGSKFSILLPVGTNVRTQQVFNKYENHDQVKNENVEPDVQNLSGRVLVAEDTPTNQILIHLLLEKIGLEVVMANDGKVAFDKAISEDFDIILMDIQMPNMNGYDATRKLRESGFTKPIIAVTAHAMKGDREKCLAAGCDDYITKPIDRNQLFSALKSHLKTKSQSLNEKVQQVTTKVNELSQMVTEQKQPDTANDPKLSDLDISELVDWNSIIEICDDEGVIKEVVDMFLKDSPRCINSIAEAINSSNAKHIRMYAHSLKGASLQIGARNLGEVAYKLECAGRDKELQDAPALFTSVQDEYGKLTLFLSQPDWIQQAKQCHNN